MTKKKKKSRVKLSFLSAIARLIPAGDSRQLHNSARSETLERCSRHASQSSINRMLLHLESFSNDDRREI